MSSLVSFVIPTKNSAKHLEKVIKRILEQTYSDVEIIVVDNNSTDNTKEIARKYTDKVFNKGPERSTQMNFGGKKAKYKYIFFLNSDCELEKDVTKECVDLCESGFDGVMVSLMHVGKGFWT
ncbi:glycosyltransferase family 2 protein, partial [Patescibacteria group bacterium]